MGKVKKTAAKETAMPAESKTTTKKEAAPKKDVGEKTTTAVKAAPKKKTAPKKPAAKKAAPAKPKETEE